MGNNKDHPQSINKLNTEHCSLGLFFFFCLMQYQKFENVKKKIKQEKIVRIQSQLLLCVRYNAYHFISFPSFSSLHGLIRGFPGGSDGKESACNPGDLGLIPRLGRYPEGGHGNPLQYSLLENPHGQRSLAGYSPWGCKEFNMTKRLSIHGLIRVGTAVIPILQVRKLLL